MKIGRIIKLLRSVKGITQKDLCAAVDLDQTTIMRIEKDIRQPSTRQLQAIAAVFGTTGSIIMMAVEGNHEPLIRHIVLEIEGES